MKIFVQLTDDGGNVLEGEVALTATDKTSTTKRGSPRKALAKAPTLDFQTSNRAFMNKHAKKLPGASKFTLLLAKLTRGKTNKNVSFKDIAKAWNRMTEVIGNFNPAHSTRAVTKGWIDSKGQGNYVLLPGWKDALEKKSKKNAAKK